MTAWSLSWRCDPKGRELADRHYNRQSIGADNFVPPGRCLVLTRPGALWVTSWPFAEFTKHAWAGAWVNSTFRRESGPLASELIRAAVAATRALWSEVPSVASEAGPVALVTFIDCGKVRRKRDFGRCYRKAGFVDIGETKGGLLALGLRVADLPDAAPASGQNLSLFAGAA